MSRIARILAPFLAPLLVQAILVCAVRSGALRLHFYLAIGCSLLTGLVFLVRLYRWTGALIALVYIPAMSAVLFLWSFVVMGLVFGDSL
jgi:hypothetical protein